MQKTILLIDDEDDIRSSLRGILEDEDYKVFEASSAEEGIDFLNKKSVSLVFLDIWLPGMDGLKALEIIIEANPNLPVVMISGHGTVESAVTAIKIGAVDFIEKPLSLEKVLLTVDRSLAVCELKKQNSQLKLSLEDKQSFDSLGPMGSSNVMVELRDNISKVAPLDTSVLITGENGTGKELVARTIHLASKRSEKPLIALNCAAIPEELIESELFGHEKGAFTGADSLKIGKFELADQGTLFLDEIGDMSLKTQAKILRILQEKTFERVGGNKELSSDVRIIAATNKNLEQSIAQGEFRQDLYYRLNVFPIKVPALRERGLDINLLAEYLSASVAQKLGIPPISFSKEVKDVLRSYSWPGNVRELRNFIERMIILYGGKSISISQLPEEIKVSLDNTNSSISKKTSEEELEFTFTEEESKKNKELKNKQEQEVEAAIACDELEYSLPDDFKTARSAFEAHFLRTKLEENGGSISKLAEAIGLERSYLYRKLKSYNIQGSN